MEAPKPTKPAAKTAVPTIAVVYGPSGFGKTADIQYTAPEAIYFTPARGSLSGSKLTGVKAKEIVVPSLKVALPKLAECRKQYPDVREYVFDDLTVLAERSHLQTADAGLDGWELWGALQKSILRLREWTLNEDLALFFTCHDAGPKPAKNGKRSTPGGPKMPSQALVQALPHIAALVLHAERDTDADFAGWTGRYICDTEDSTWIAKDRYTVVPAESPMNLREILWCAKETGSTVRIPRRPPGLEWLDEAADEIAALTISGADTAATKAWMRDQGAGKGTMKIGNYRKEYGFWAWRDGRARAFFRENNRFAQVLSDF